MKTPHKRCLSLLATFSLIAGPASAATAHGNEDPDHGPGAGGGGYQPIYDEYYDDIVVQACGTTVTLRSGDVREVEEKVQVKHDGTTVIRIRGDYTNDVIAEPGGDLPYGGFIDELDISGAGSTRISADGTNVVQTLAGPSLIFPADPVQTAALLEAGFPELSYFEQGKLVIETIYSQDETGVEPDSVVVLKNTARGVIDLCQALKESAEYS